MAFDQNPADPFFRSPMDTPSQPDAPQEIPPLPVPPPWEQPPPVEVPQLPPPQPEFQQMPPQIPSGVPQPVLQAPALAAAASNDAPDNYEPIGNYNEIEYVREEAQKLNNAAQCTPKTEKSSDATENAEQSQVTECRARNKRRSRRNRGISLWVYAVLLILVLVGCMACTVTYVHGILDNWFQ